MADQVSLVEYLFQRLKELGVRSVHGVPGDYTLTMLDYVKPMGLRWVGNANELNAGYAADGYARTKGISALITSFGVGELSAINAVAGAYAEKAPVVHVVGTAPIAAQKMGANLHHSLGDGNLRVFANMYKSVTVAQANLIDVSSAPDLIDSTLRQCLLQSRPVYIEVPIDMVNVKLPRPTGPIDHHIPGYSEIVENQAVDRLLEKIQGAQRPLMLVDGFTARFDVHEELNALIKLTGFPTLTTPFGKSVVNETLPNFHGIFYGMAGSADQTAWVQNCDLVLHFGPLLSDTNTFGFTALPSKNATIVLEKHSMDVGESSGNAKSYSGLCIKSLLGKVASKLKQAKLKPFEPFPEDPTHPRELLKTLQTPPKDKPIDQYTFWLYMSKHFKSGDVVMTESGTSSYGCQSFVLPQDKTVVCSSIWLSIGYMLAAAQGVSLAKRDAASDGITKPSRTILFEGDGSLQMSAQAISDIIRNRLDVIIFVINNNGYTVERIIHGFDEDYNDIQPWRNLEAPSYFGAPANDPSYPVRTRTVKTWGDLQSVMEDPEIQEGKGLNMIEVFMSIEDAPESLTKFVEYIKARASAAAK